jgi:hypothetical protein
MRVATCPVLIIGLLVGFVVTTRAQVSTINIDKTCQAAAGVTVKSTVEQDFKICHSSCSGGAESRDVTSASCQA